MNQERKSYRTTIIPPASRVARRLRVFCLLPLLVLSGACADDRLQRQRQAYQQSLVAIESGQAVTAEARQLLSDYPLAAYLRMAELQRLLTEQPDAADAQIAEFLTTHGEQPVSWRLRNLWLLSLAEREQWAALSSVMSELSSDPLLRCHQLRARLEIEQTEGLAEPVLEQWTQGRDQPAACNPVFDWAFEQGLIDEQRIRKRLKLALEARQTSLARYLIRQLPDGSTEAELWRLKLISDPDGGLRRWLDEPDSRAEKAWLIEAHWWLARRAPEQAEALFPKLKKKARMNAVQAGELQRSIALGLAYDRHARALDWFKKLPESAIDEHVHEWRIRSALLHEQWSLAARWLAELPEADSRSARWQYWSGRVAAQLENMEQARQHFEAAAQEREYYGFLAAERLGRRGDPQHHSLARVPELEQALLRQPGMLRARELAAVGEYDYARSEWAEQLRDLDRRTHLTAAQLAADWGWHHQAIIVLAVQQHWDDVLLRFPLPWREAADQAAEAAGLNVLWTYTIARAESLFDPRAHSAANAHGLMQMLPSTARQVAREVGAPEPTIEDLYKPAVNLPLASVYLRQLYERFERWPMAMAAYNAGPHRIPGWQLEREVPADIWIENIPYNETRAYVQRAMMNVVIYGWRLTDEPTRLLPLLQPIPASESES